MKNKKGSEKFLSKNKKGDQRFLSKNKKAVGISIKPLISIILVVVVVGFVFLSIFSPNLWDWVKNLPSYSYNDSDRLIDFSSEGDDRIVLNDWYKVAKISGGTKIIFCNNGNCNDPWDSKLIIKGGEGDFGVYVNQRVDDKIGTMKRWKVEIESKALHGLAEFYSKVGADLPEDKFLLNLNEAIYSNADGIFYREKELKIECPILVGKLGGFENRKNTFFKQRFIYMNGETDFYYKGEDRAFGEIFVSIDGTDLKIADVDDGIIEIVDESSELYKKELRFLNLDKNKLFDLNGAYNKHNFLICRDEEVNEIEKMESFAAEALDFIYLDLNEVNSQGRIDLSSFIDKGGYDYFYLKERKDYIEIKGSVNNWLDRGQIGRITSDGVMWIDIGKLIKRIPGLLKSKPGARIISNSFDKKKSEFYEEGSTRYEFYETNLKIDYQGVKGKL